MAARVEIGKFDGTKFSLWKLKMKAVLIKDNCLEAIGTRPAEITDDQKWKRIDAMALSNLHLGLSDDILSGVEEKGTAKEVWDHLIKLYEAKSETSQGCVAEADILYSEAATVFRDRSELTDAWILDSGATWHMTSRRDWFHTYEPISVGSVYMGNDHALEIAGVGSIKLKMYDGMVRTVQNVRHVKGLKKNLLSLGQLDEIGCATRIHNGMMRVVKGPLVVMKAERIAANLYRLLGDTCLEADTLTKAINTGKFSWCKSSYGLAET